MAGVCRHYFEEYVALPRAKKELLINNKNVDVVKRSIKKGEQVSFEYRGEFMTVSPCFIANSPSNVHAYLVGILIKNINAENDEFHAYRILRIKNVAQIPESIAAHVANFKLTQKANEFKKNFDPFLCYGQKVIASLTQKGLEIYNRTKTNRPIMISSTLASMGIAQRYKNESRTTCIFQCSEKLAEIYFPQFLEEVEIIAPDSLRAKFKKRLNAAINRYKN